MWFLVAAICGLVLPGWLPLLLDAWFPPVCGLTGLLLTARGWTLSGAFLLGFAWSASFGLASLEERLPLELHGRSLVLQGEVVSLLRTNEYGTRLILHPRGQAEVGRIRLSLDLVPEAGIMPGETWRFCVRLRYPRGQVNPHGLSRSAWLLRAGITAEGQVTGACRPERQKAKSSLTGQVHRLRQQLLAGLAAEPLLHQGLLGALMVGEGQGLSERDWRLLRITGTLHLFVISGLHMTLVAGMGMLCGRFFAGFLPARPWCRPLPFVLALLLISFYALLAGGGLSVQRAWISLSAALIMLSLSRRVTVWRLLLISMLLVLAADPLAVQFAGFWLSFGAVAALLYQFHNRSQARRRGLVGWLLLLLKIELVLMLLLGATLGFWTGEFPVLSVLANCLAMPLVSFLLVPLLLLAALDLLAGSPFGAGRFLLAAADVVLHVILQYLGALAELSPDFFSHLQSVTLVTVIPALAGCWLLGLPRGFPMRWLGGLLLAWLLLPGPAGPELELLIFDVGQGTAIAVRTRHQLLLYDLGPAGSFHWNLLPWLRSLPHAPAYLVLSHGDADHAGAWQYAEGIRRHAKVITSRASALQLNLNDYTDCSGGHEFFLDGIRFRFLTGTPGESDNESSCVLHIKTAAFGLLLTGDIGSAREASLLGELGSLQADLLLVPHHGSHSSSSPAFLNALMPDYAVVSAGFKNRFGHPRPHIVRRYEARGARLLNTAETGAVQVRVAGQEMRIRLARSSYPRYWDR